MSSFSATRFVNDVARASARRLCIPQDGLAHAFDAAKLTLPGSLDQPNPWQVDWPVARADMASEVWIIARMALDVRTMIEKANDLEHSAVCYGDMHDLGWAPDQVRTYVLLALSFALTDLRTRRNTEHQQQFSGFAAAMGWAGTALITGGIALTLVTGLFITALVTV
jgi:hypothetical protein